MNIEEAVNLSVLYDNIFTYTLRDGSCIVFYIDKENHSISAKFPYIFQARDGSFYRYTQKRDYLNDFGVSDHLYAFICDTILSCQQGVYNHLIVR